MADISVTAGSVSEDTTYIGNTFDSGLAGEAGITAGMSVYVSSNDGKVYKAICSALDASQSVGITVNGAGLNQPVRFQKTGQMNIGATVAVGTVYVVSSTAGGIAPNADLVTGNYVTVLGVATTTGKLLLGLIRSKTAHA